MVFQDSISAVNPRKTVREILREPMRHLLSLKNPNNWRAPAKC